MSPHEEHPAGGTTLVIDPVCGEKVDPTTAAATRKHDGTTFYFASLECADTFDADPHRYGHPHDRH